MAAMSLIMAGGWLLQRRTGNSGFVDAAWTFGLGAVGAASALLVLPGGDGPTARQTIVAALVAAWSVRLGTHIVQRTRTIADDPRYAALMNDWGAEAPRRLFVFLQQQAIASLPLALTIFVAAQNPDDPWSRAAPRAAGAGGKAAPAAPDRAMTATMNRRRVRRLWFTGAPRRTAPAWFKYTIVANRGNYTLERREIG